MNTAHNGAHLGEALFKLCDRLKIVEKIGHIASDNATNNDTMIQEFAECYEKRTGKVFPCKTWHVRCLAHMINLSAQAVISTRSQTKYYNPHTKDDHMPDVMANDWDEIGLVRAICVKARSSLQRKEFFDAIQGQHGVKALKLLLDLMVRWSSTYIMLHRAESRRSVMINDFIFELSMREKNLGKRRKIVALQLSNDEWKRVTLFLNLLGYADDVQQAFSAEAAPTLFNALPAIKKLYAQWEKALGKDKYKPFAAALEAGMEKVDEYYCKTAASDVHIMAMLISLMTCDLKALAEKKFSERYSLLGNTSVHMLALLLPLHENSSQPGGIRRKPWLMEYNLSLDTVESMSEDMDIVQWWGFNAHRYLVGASLVRDYLAVMASLVSSERTFSAAGITISKRPNRL
ncbi:hypothetical protein D9613_012193 [Agrocybe pediades]|uniref:HAT C-terminal dimerisation domain-containing protein n=1 Tax=Agrocybe pediades TaxID=84607 RepID=A0A8H4R521_9AGAR|nr:hypothetical protein D9613_012193 [Agrocybe pediades]